MNVVTDARGQVELRFHGEVVRSGNHVNLSAVRTDGECLWLAGDETATVERLVLDSSTAPTRADDQLSVRLADLVELPGGPDDEADVEGLARAGEHLWVVGSHSLVRKRIKPRNSEEKGLRRLAAVRRDPNRFVLARLAVEPGPDGRPVPVRVTTDGRSSALVGAPGADNLADLLAADEHLGPFLAIPSKDNGLDVEGLAVHGDSVYVGLRGPVLRGWAVVVEVRPVGDPDDPGRLRLGAFADGTRYRKHVLDLGGLGVRDLCPHGDDLLVLAGPTMSLSGPVRVYRWHRAAHTETHRVVRGDELTVETELPHGDGEDHPEGIGLLPGTPPRLLVVYDSPSARRRPTPHSVLADIVPLGSATTVGRPADEPAVRRAERDG